MIFRNCFLLLSIFFFSCKGKEKVLPTEETETILKLKKYQQYALNRIIEADADDQGFSLIDSFYLWSWDDFGIKFRENRITRTYDKGIYHYIFWAHLKNFPQMYAEDSILATNLLNDTLLDVNHDGIKDFLATYKTESLRPDYADTLLYLSDTISRRFMKVSN